MNFCSEQAILFKEALDASLASRGLSIPGDAFFLKELNTALMFSKFIATSLIKTPEILMDLLDSKDLYRTYSPGEYIKKTEPILNLPEKAHVLQRFLGTLRLREMVRIAWRDLNGHAALEETMADLSALADACVETAMTVLHEKLCTTHGVPMDPHGDPLKIIVLGMGKLGAGELNFSSDIDLIFAFPREGTIENAVRMPGCEAFFTKLCREFLNIFNSRSTGLPIFRVDTRLRPFGESGPLVMSCEAMEIYYQTQGREWERYALIKARPMAGDLAAGHALLATLKPFVFRRYLDYGTFDAFRDMKARITMQIRDKRWKNNIKLGAGGIREIEFFGQLFQLIRGGVTPRLQEKKILKVLALLAREGFINAATARDLKSAYVFLRTVEHRLQEYDDRQTHDIPGGKSKRHCLALSMGFDSWDGLEKALHRHMDMVHQHFNKLLVSKESKKKNGKAESPFRYLWETINDPQADVKASLVSGYTAPEKVLQSLETLAEHPHTRKLTRTGRRRLNDLIPLVAEIAGEQPQPEITLERLISLIIAIEQRTCYLSLLLENPTAIITLATLATQSPWIISFLSRHPALLDELLDPATLYKPPDRPSLERDLAHRMAAIPPEDFEFQLEELCLFKLTGTLRVAAADISGDYPLMKVSDALTDIAETVLQQVLCIAWQQTRRRYGVPSGIEPAPGATPGFAAVAYGKLGGIELGYKSDLDLVFVHSESRGVTSGGPRSIENMRFYTLLGQRIITMLTMHTPAGTLYKPDMRLRPSGQAGMIVSHIDAFYEYMETQAWTWEHQAIIRARPVAGDPLLWKKFNAIRQQVMEIKRHTPTLRQEIREMRERMKKQRFDALSHGFDIKQGRGGIVDIEFLVQFLTLNHARNHPALIRWTDNIRLIETLEKERILSETQALNLRETYIVLRKALHRLDLKEKTEYRPGTDLTKKTRMVSQLFQRMLYD
ncbi:bifunctional [glutamate--ammonia ligase]-adenylyl-L-tyrosine phosphorylase/[glutamate--ammonia-ligase] adenylyltransferase [Desulfocicer vacuolatum]|uniref:bifunctional [glutamate--ammonia ligase]-adenylyl-L-tyrosine phosphorylase/[glutamate--ammonia-ligase] adenylyltransferase n=1 Tax=Desulfocicer vacuolatum TaxID=2298 RepID=UPI00111C31FE|nr:bifunctional [glutamate--ammonia ligase]-adenylyl-L-tyrosine phosphorylase/[glutamate--ammonia-ligase] adenylyltransferase [Desulfocicer vacuolatum]